ncbi:hypothetical protein [Schleiferilactobacillus shenzhenensis]|uniref:Uncharacterized protein n=1 Tax=Schleiferilactobacillus shenzhenensis LY-73 TaxID=1231336 RepID=U4THF0_9LACO|nr:hypothetical protein [Schleiferilactobacillus shenzhenensis]ERL64236.1 hypothetical protein L248_1419 [Schleiferilactobacillus shenzhenensis LY-73]
MDTDELADYIEQNSNVKTVWMEKVIAHLNEVNDHRAPAKRWNKAIIQHQADRMYDDFINDVHDKIMMAANVKASDSAQTWANTIEQNEILDNLEESIADTEFGDDEDADDEE